MSYDFISDVYASFCVVAYVLFVPVEELEEALKYDSTTFERRYGFKKPSLNERIVTYCRAGVRSMKAGILLHQHSYTKYFYKCFNLIVFSF